MPNNGATSPDCGNIWFKSRSEEMSLKQAKYTQKSEIYRDGGGSGSRGKLLMWSVSRSEICHIKSWKITNIFPQLSYDFLSLDLICQIIVYNVDLVWLWLHNILYMAIMRYLILKQLISSKIFITLGILLRIG